MLWQLNDCWPVASWSSRDYYGRWKALHYVTRKAYDDILVSPRVKDVDAKALENKQVAALPGATDVGVKHSADVAMERKVLELKLVNDRRSAAPGTIVLQTLTLDGRKVYEEKRSVKLPKNCAIDVKTWRVADILGGERPENVIFHITYTTGGKTYDNIAYAVRQKEMSYSKPNLTTTVTPVGDGYDVKISTDRFARAVFLKIKGIDNFFSDNYFDMLPNTSRTIHVRSSKNLETFRKELETTCLVNNK